MKRSQVIILCLLLVLGFISCNNQNEINNALQNIDIQLGNINFETRFIDDYYDLEIIPLETKKECMLGNYAKMYVADAGIYISDEYDFIYKFNHDGTYDCKIGSIGHAKNEYVRITDFAISPKGDTIGLLTDMSTLKTYDSKGKYIATQELPTNKIGDYDMGWDYVLLTSKGLMVNDFHHCHENAISLLDKKSNILSKFIDVNVGIIRKSPISTFVPFQQDGNLVCYYDQLDSHFYILNLNDYGDVKSYALKSDNILTEEKALEMNLWDDKYDRVDSYVFADSMIVGSMINNGYSCDFKFDLRDNSMKCVSYKDYNITFCDYYNGCYYGILSPEFLVDLINLDINDKNTPYYKIDQYNMFRSILEPLKDKVSDKDNYYLLKVKMKK